MPFYLKKGDLVEANVDAIVNASNVNLKMVEGVGRAIFHKAGDADLSKACKAIGRCDVGKAVLTPSFNLVNCKGIIHAVGPIYINGKHDEEKNLRSAYVSSLNICLDQGYKSVAFPLLSGEFNYPQADAYEVAESVFKDFLKKHKEMVIYMIIFKNFPDLLDEETHEHLKNFIIANFDATSKDRVQNTNIEFKEALLKLMEEKKISKEELIDRANILPRTYENLMNDPTYIPSKSIALALAIALRLSDEDFKDFMRKIGYTSMNNSVQVLVCLFFIKRNKFDVLLINTALFNYEVNPLGLE